MKTSLFLSAAKTYALDLLFPPFCAGCGSEGTLLCPACDAGLRFIPPSCFVCKKLVPARGTIAAGRTCAACREKSRIHAFISPFSYDTPAIRDLLHGLKYHRRGDHAAILAGLLHRAIAYHGVVLSRAAVFIPIPLSPARERVRGFNQSALIAEVLGSAIGIPVQSDILKKIKKTKPQMSLSREERLTNLAGAYAVSDRAAVRGKNIILLDDVKTTGATLKEAAKVLKQAGAKKIWAITVAH